MNRAVGDVARAIIGLTRRHSHSGNGACVVGIVDGKFVVVEGWGWCGQADGNGGSVRGGANGGEDSVEVYCAIECSKQGDSAEEDLEEKGQHDCGCLFH